MKVKRFFKQYGWDIALCSAAGVAGFIVGRWAYRVGYEDGFNVGGQSATDALLKCAKLDPTKFMAMIYSWDDDMLKITENEIPLLNKVMDASFKH